MTEFDIELPGDAEFKHYDYVAYCFKLRCSDIYSMCFEPRDRPTFWCREWTTNATVYGERRIP